MKIHIKIFQTLESDKKILNCLFAQISLIIYKKKQSSIKCLANNDYY